MSDKNVSIKPLGLEMARELSTEELMNVGGGALEAAPASTGSAGGKVTSGGDWEVNVGIDG